MNWTDPIRTAFVAACFGLGGIFLVGASQIGPVFAEAVDQSRENGPDGDKNALEQSVAPDSRLEEVEAYLNSVQSLKADFIQRSPDGLVAEGTLALERPGRLRFDYAEDVPLLVVSDGTTLSFIDYDVNQVTRWPIMDTPLGILVAREINFHDGLIVNTSLGEDGLLRVSVQDPKRIDEGYITLIFEQDPMVLRAWDAVDPQGMVTRVALVNVDTNVELSRSLFDFDDPRARPFSGRRRR